MLRSGVKSSRISGRARTALNDLSQKARLNASELDEGDAQSPLTFPRHVPHKPTLSDMETARQERRISPNIR